MNGINKIIVKFGAVLIAFTLMFAMFPVSAFAADAEEVHSVDIYFSVSHDASFFKTPEDEVIAFKKITVPYFDLALYGLQQYYFSSENYGKDEDYMFGYTEEELEDAL